MFKVPVGYLKLVMLKTLTKMSIYKTNANEDKKASYTGELAQW